MGFWSPAYDKLKGIFTNTDYGYNRGNHEDINELTYSINVSKLQTYTMNAYRFDGLPDTLDQNLLWALLIMHGSLVIFYDKNESKFRALPYVRVGDKNSVNYLFEPIEVDALEFDGKKKRIVTTGILTESEIKSGVEKGVILYISNTSRFLVPFNHFVSFYANKLTDIERSMDIRRHYHKVPAMFSADEKYKSTFVKIFEGIIENKPFFVNKKNFTQDLMMTPMDFNYMNDKLIGEKTTILNEFLIQIGVSVNNQEDKTERVNTQEVSVIQQQVQINRRNIMNSLESFADKFNKMFGEYAGEDVSVSFIHNTKIDELYEQYKFTGGNDYDTEL